MPLNINATPSITPPNALRRRLAESVLDEMLSWNPREFISAFRRWHRNAFSLIHLNVLTELDIDGPQSMSHLAEALDVSVASMTGIVDRMERRGLVERRHGEPDRRVVVVEPTDAGRAVFQEIDTRRREGLASLLEHLSDSELEALRTGHRALRQARGAAVAAHAAPASEQPRSPAVNPPDLHGASTIDHDDAPVEPLSGVRP